MEIKNLIPFFGIDRQYLTIRDELLNASDEVYRTGQVLGGQQTFNFELAIAERCQRRYAVAVGSCTQGLIFSLMAGPKAGEKVMIPTISFAATINSVLLSGHEPVFCDTDYKALIDLESSDYALKGAGVGAIMYANLFGNTIDYDRFRVMTEFFNQDLFILEDAAQSFGASYKGIPSGKLGTASVLSFDPTKNLPNYGSGGMILTDDYEFFCNVVDLRDNGKTSGHQIPGTNSRMSESDCAQMLVKLKYFDAWQKRRTAIAEYYIENLVSYVDVLLPNEDVVHAWHKFVIRLSNRHALMQYMRDAGIETKMHYDKPLFELPVGYEYTDYMNEFFRESSAYTRECMSLPIYPEMTDAEVEHVVRTIKQFFS